VEVETQKIQRPEVTIEWKGTAGARPPVLFKSPTISNRELSEVLPPGSWEGRPAFIMGGGPSLEGFEWGKLRGHRTIGVNLAFYKFNPTITFSMDTRFLNWILNETYEPKYPGIKAKFEKTPAYKVWCLTYSAKLPADIYIIKVFKNHDFGMRNFSFNMSEGIGHGNNSGFGALNLAFVLGANPIYLLGYDMSHTETRTHWHEGHPIVQKKDTVEGYKTIFAKWAPKIKEAGVRVINLNPESALRCFEFMRQEEVLC
jgi:hypothetical protein